MTVTLENVNHDLLKVLKSLVKLQPKVILKTDDYSDKFAKELQAESKQTKEDIKNGTAVIYLNAQEAIRALNE